ncbi:hypothetical protein ACVWYG_003844 [Pedobacter sp. UYEF25]
MDKIRKVYLDSRILFHLALIPLATIFVFWPVYRFDFLFGWDDQWFVTNFYTEGGFAPSNLWLILTDFYHGQYAPINQLYYTLLYKLFGYRAGVFHMASVAIHFINCGLIYLFLKKLLGGRSQIGR